MQSTNSVAAKIDPLRMVDDHVSRTQSQHPRNIKKRMSVIFLMIISVKPSSVSISLTLGFGTPSSSIMNSSVLARSQKEEFSFSIMKALSSSKYVPVFPP
jgi:hypothetical protein